jgi:hypothetical protein
MREAATTATRLNGNSHSLDPAFTDSSRRLTVMISKAVTSTHGTTVCSTLLNFSCRSAGLTAVKAITAARKRARTILTASLTLATAAKRAVSMACVLGSGKAKRVMMKASRKRSLTIWKSTKASSDCMQPR